MYYHCFVSLPVSLRDNDIFYIELPSLGIGISLNKAVYMQFSGKNYLIQLSFCIALLTMVIVGK